jgi:hypothetical protein
MALLLSKQTESTFEQAKDIYERGSFSKSIAEITFDENGDVQIDAGTVVSVTLDDLSIVIGTVMDDVPVGTKPMRIQYQVLDNGGSTCNVGGNPTPVLDGCKFKFNGAAFVITIIVSQEVVVSFIFLPFDILHCRLSRYRFTRIRRILFQNSVHV